MLAQRADLASARIRHGLAVSDVILDEVLSLRTATNPHELFTADERRELESDRRWPSLAREVLADADDVLGGIQSCWIDGRRGVRVLVTARQDELRERLAARLGADRVIVETGPASEQSMRDLQERVSERSDDLRADGIFLSRWGSGIDGFVIEYTGPDPVAGDRTLRSLFGDILVLRWRGASNHTFRPFPFGSWHAEGETLHIFYGLPHNGEAPGLCQAFEDESAVVVSLTVKDWLGAKRLVGGFTPMHATVELQRPLEARAVIDASANRARPHWSQA